MSRLLEALPAMMVRSIGATVSARASDRSLLVLTYHRVLREPDPLLAEEPDSTAFSRQLRLLRQAFNPLGLHEALDRLAGGSLPPRAVCMTFDDGYANNCTVALPLLREHGVPATVFVATGYLDGGRMFNDTIIEAVRRAGPELDLTTLGLGRHELPDAAARRRAIDRLLPAVKHLHPAERRARAEAIADIVGAELPGDLMMTQDHVRQLAHAGIELGAHTVHHPILSSVSPERARREIEQSRHVLEEMGGCAVSGFAYPNGRPGHDYGAMHVRMVRDAGYAYAVSTARGAATARCDRWQLPRVSPWGQSVLRRSVNLALSYGDRTAECA